MARDNKEILKECEAFLEGHFLLSSGRHSGAYCQMAFLQQYPDKCAEVMATVAEKRWLAPSSPATLLTPPWPLSARNSTVIPAS